MRDTFFKNFCNNCSEYEKSVNEKSISIQIHNQTCNYLCVVFLEALQLYQTSSQIKRDFETAAISPLDKTTICPPSAISSPILLVETFEFSLEVPLSIYRFEKMCFPSKDAKLFSLMNHAQPSMNKHECAIVRQRFSFTVTSPGRVQIASDASMSHNLLLPSNLPFV